MIRLFAIIAVASFIVSSVTLTAAVAIAGPDVVASGAWTWTPHGWGRSEDDDDRPPPVKPPVAGPKLKT